MEVRFKMDLFELLSPAGARAVTSSPAVMTMAVSRCCPPQGRELLHDDIIFSHTYKRLLSPAGARVVTDEVPTGVKEEDVAVPRRGASCYMKFWRFRRPNELLSPAGARAVT